MSYAEAEAEAEASLSRSDSVAGFGVFVMFFLGFDDRIPALPRPPPQSPHSAAVAATSTHVLDIYFQPGHEGQGIDLLSGDVKGQKRVGTEQCQSSQKGGAWPAGLHVSKRILQGGIVIAGAYKAQQFQPLSKATASTCGTVPTSYLDQRVYQDFPSQYLHTN